MSKKAALVESKQRLCPECGTSRLMNDQEQGELVCMNCGYVVDDNIADTGPEWRAFNDEQIAKKTRVGPPLTYTIHDKGLSTLIDWNSQYTYGKKMLPIQVS